MDLLSDPLNNRVVKQVKPPPHHPLDSKYIFTPPGSKFKVDWQMMKTHLTQEGRIAKIDLIKIIQEANKLFCFHYFYYYNILQVSEKNLLRIKDPVTIVGDLHGQFYDLLKLLELGGNPEETQYLFLGDIIDRGNFSIETALLVYTLKIAFPKTILLLRGNHECREMTTYFNFKEECLFKYDQEIYEIFMDSFDKLPLTCIINDQIFACHGGISPELITVDLVEKINRFTEPPKFGLFCDLLWSDPNPKEVKSSPMFTKNTTRGCSYFYNNEAAVNFLNKNNLLSVVRGHEVQLEGYKMYEFNQQKQFPSIITIFSAPNYCDAYNNKGAIIKFKDNNFTIMQYTCSTHPYLLPNFMDIFTWSIPFVIEKLSQILESIVKQPEEDYHDSLDELDEQQYDQLIQSHEDQKQKLKLMDTNTNDPNLEAESLIQEKKQFQEKIKCIARIKKKSSMMRENNEQLMFLSGYAPDSRIPNKLLLNRSQSSEGFILNKNILLEQFCNIKEFDQINEKRPNAI